MKSVLILLVIGTLCSITCIAQEQPAPIELKPGASIPFFVRGEVFGFNRSFLQSPDNASTAYMAKNASVAGCQVLLTKKEAGSERIVWASPCGLARASSSFKCMVDFTSSGNFEFSVDDTAVWSTNTAGMGVNLMRLLDNTTLVLSNNGSSVWSSSSVPSSSLCEASSLPPSSQLPQSFADRKYTFSVLSVASLVSLVLFAL